MMTGHRRSAGLDEINSDDVAALLEVGRLRDQVELLRTAADPGRRVLEVASHGFQGLEESRFGDVALV